MTETTPSAPFQVRSLTLSVFLPHGLFATGHGAITPVIALFALELGASVPVAGFIVGIFGLGGLLAAAPGGALIARLGDRVAMATSSAVLGGAGLAAATRPSLLVYALLIGVMGAAAALFGLARLTFATEATPLGHRGRVMSMIGGVARMGLFAGPLLGAVAIDRVGLAGPFVLQAAMVLTAFGSLLLIRDNHGSARPAREAQPSVFGVAVEHRRILATAGVSVIALQVVRSSRQAVIPLWGAQIGLSASQVALLFSLAAAIEISIFYPIGHLMDRWGRRWVALTALGLLSIGMAVVPLTGSFGALVVVAVIFGVGNGIGAGINMTLSSDLSPDVGRSQFFGVWRVVSDVGTASGPALVGAIASLATLAAAPVAVALVGLSGALLFWRTVPETLRRP